MNRIVCGLLSMFLSFYMLTFARVVTVPDNTKIRVEDQVLYRTGSVDRVKLTLPAPPATGKVHTFSAKWAIVPLTYGLWCIGLGEFQLWRRKREP